MLQGGLHSERDVRLAMQGLHGHALRAPSRPSHDGVEDRQPLAVRPKESCSTCGLKTAVCQVSCNIGLVIICHGDLCPLPWHWCIARLCDPAECCRLRGAHGLLSAIGAWPSVTLMDHEKECFDIDNKPFKSHRQRRLCPGTPDGAACTHGGVKGQSEVRCTFCADGVTADQLSQLSQLNSYHRKYEAIAALVRTACYFWVCPAHVFVSSRKRGSACLSASLKDASWRF